MEKTRTMQRVQIEKVTLNMGVGQAGEELERAVEIMRRITDRKPVQTKCKVKAPVWDIREGLPIGAKVTLRKGAARAFLERALSARDKKLNRKSFDKLGNFGFGIKEYIDLPGARYDPKLGIRGLDVIVTLEKPGYRVKRRKKCKARVGRGQLVTPSEAQSFLEKEFGVTME